MRTMKLRSAVFLLVAVLFAASAFAQEKKLERIRVGGGSASATQMSMWLAKEAGLYEKNGLSVEAISIPGSSLALQAMLAGEGAVIQLGGRGATAANFSFPSSRGRASNAWRICAARFLARRASALFPISPRASR